MIAAGIVPLIEKGISAVGYECSVVVPLWNSARTISALHIRLSAMLRRLAVPYEILYVDDGSTDRTAEMISELQAQDPCVKTLLLSRHFGSDAALWAGLDHAAGRCVVTMPGDLRDPPELISDLLSKWRDGSAVVTARPREARRHLLGHGVLRFVRRYAGRRAYRRENARGRDYALMDRRVVEEFTGLSHRTVPLAALRQWVGFAQTEVLYDREPGHGDPPLHCPPTRVTAVDGKPAGASGTGLPSFDRLGAGIYAVAIAAAMAVGAGIGSWAAGESASVWISSILVLLGGLVLVHFGSRRMLLMEERARAETLPAYVIREKHGFRSHPRPAPRVIDFIPHEPAALQERLTQATRTRHGHQHPLLPQTESAME